MNVQRAVYLILAGIVLTGSLLLTSCKTPRAIIRKPIKEEGADYLFNRLKEKELKFDWFSARFMADYRNAGQEITFTGQIRIRKDSLIWLSLSMLGIEGMRLMITQDSVRYLNRMNSTYLAGTWDYLNNFLNTKIDYDVLQSFLIGNDLSFYEEGKFKASIDKSEYKLTSAGRRKIKKYIRNHEDELKVLIQNIWLDPETFKITRADVKELRKENIKLDATYTSFEAIGTQLFPREMTFQILAENRILVRASFSRITVSEPLQFPFRIPASYHPVRLR
jgi:hypothetical protein